MQCRQKRHLPSDENDMEWASKRAAVVPSISAANGVPLGIVKWPRKVHSDKGKKRKPQEIMDMSLAANITAPSPLSTAPPISSAAASTAPATPAPAAPAPAT